MNFIIERVAEYSFCIVWVILFFAVVMILSGGNWLVSGIGTTPAAILMGLLCYCCSNR